jgi:RNA 2',3'-cyclic 3'-phosphodiesterase
MRCFVAVNIADPIKQRLADLQKQLQRVGPGVRWVSVASQHITLKFLGEIATPAVQAVEQACREAAGSSRRMELRICRLGAFPSLQQPRVFWTGIQEEGQQLSALAARLESLLLPLGFEAEKRSWSPHITLGRVKDAFALKLLTDYIRIESPAFDAGSFIAEQMILYQSVLRPEGALYTPLKRFPFEGN